MKEINIVIGNVCVEDIDLFFGPILECDEFDAPIDTDINFQTLLKTHGFIKNTKQARDLGLTGPISEGFTDLTIGKKKRRLTILKITQGE